MSRKANTVRIGDTIRRDELLYLADLLWDCNSEEPFERDRCYLIGRQIIQFCWITSYTVGKQLQVRNYRQLTMAHELPRYLNVVDQNSLYMLLLQLLPTEVYDG